MEEKSLDKELETKDQETKQEEAKDKELKYVSKQEAKQEPKQESSIQMDREEVSKTLDSVLSSEQKAEYLKKYVGEGKKYKSVEDLAKSYAHAEQFIRTLKKEKEEMEQEMEHLREAAKLVKEFEEEQKLNQDVDIDSKIQEALQKEKQKEIAMKNRLTLKQMLLDHFKDESKAVEAIENFTRSDPSRQELFYKLIDIDPNSVAKLLGINDNQQKVTSRKFDTTFGEGSAERTSVASGVLPITWSEARKVRTNDPAKYKSHNFQQLLHKSAIEAEKQGIDFFKT